MGDRLFDVGPDPAPEPVAALSADQRRTLRRQQMLAAGRHPTTRRPLLGQDGAVCGNCAHLRGKRHNRTYWKCAKYPGGPTGGPASDVRVGWPACDLWEQDDA